MYDKCGVGISVGHIKDIRVLDYVDDVAMMDGLVEDMTTRLTTFVDADREHTDMTTKISKTNSQMLGKRQSPTATTEKEVKDKQLTYKHTCIRINSSNPAVVRDSKQNPE